MRFYPTRIETILTIALIMIALSWMGGDQLRDQKKTAEVMASTQPQQIANNAQAEHQRQLTEIDKQGRSMTGYDQIATK